MSKTKTKTKVISLANHKGHEQSNDPIWIKLKTTIPSILRVNKVIIFVIIIKRS